jgi:hypothetical protein
MGLLGTISVLVESANTGTCTCMEQCDADMKAAMVVTTTKNSNRDDGDFLWIRIEPASSSMKSREEVRLDKLDWIRRVFLSAQPTTPNTVRPARIYSIFFTCTVRTYVY